MYVVINIAGDPTSWWTESVTDASTLAAELTQAPTAVEVFAPLTGNLVISNRATASIVDMIAAPHSWIPSGATAPIATLYLPSPGGVSGVDPGYALPVGTDLDELADQVMSAMTGDAVTVPVSSSDGTGVALLNGATLTFALICPPPPPPS
jgi:hypothetical protein